MARKNSKLRKPRAMRLASWSLPLIASMAALVMPLWKKPRMPSQWLLSVKETGSGDKKEMDLGACRDGGGRRGRVTRSTRSRLRVYGVFHFFFIA